MLFLLCTILRFSCWTSSVVGENILKMISCKFFYPNYMHLFLFLPFNKVTIISWFVKFLLDFTFSICFSLIFFASLAGASTKYCRMCEPCPLYVEMWWQWKGAHSSVSVLIEQFGSVFKFYFTMTYTGLKQAPRWIFFWHHGMEKLCLL